MDSCNVTTTDLNYLITLIVFQLQQREIARFRFSFLLMNLRSVYVQ